MDGYEVRFRVYADSQEEADEAARAIKEFIGDNARCGVAITARKIAEAVRKWGGNPIVRGFFRR